MRGISKRFPGVRALSNVDFTVRAGEIHALMGENGAGKSTLIKTLTGAHPRDSGEILFAGSPLSPASPREAEAAGISTVYQEVNLLPNLSVAENIMLGRQPSRFGLIRWGAVRRGAERALARLGLNLDVQRGLASYSVALQQMIAIARALDVEARLLVLDEPTSSLDERETAELFAVMRDLRRRGLGLIFVTHFLDQVYAVSDRITVLRNGELVGEFETAALPRLDLIGKMLGRSPESLPAHDGPGAQPLLPDSAPSRRVFFEARGLGRRGAIAPFDLSLARGEVAGLAGLLGSGRSEIARLLFGIDAPDSGETRIEGEEARLSSPRQAIRRGIGFCSEDRKNDGIIPHLSVRENLLLAAQASRGALRRIGRKEQRAIVDHYIRALSIKTPSPETPIRNLSGGNQQKTLLARWLALQPKLIILDEPTRGVDVGAKAEIETLIDDLRKKGMAILFISSELEEIVRNCQRVSVLRDRRKVGELSGEEIEADRIMRVIAQVHEP
ncbi:MAG: Ribose import ATP-binding protein RbsA [candidate division BRC1 bacterium ADurb.BinA364]|nr:MAG: Ribose import ATP-binding protein RbsA [candidate division BRC1 bacterium ADurb.BinA364]